MSVKTITAPYQLTIETDHQPLFLTDPCYNQDVWCRETVLMKKGDYSVSYDVLTDEYGDHLSKVTVYPSQYKTINDFLSKHPEYTDGTQISIGVDSGLAGIYTQKADMERPENNNNDLDEFMDSINDDQPYTISNSDNVKGITFSTGDGFYEGMLYQGLNDLTVAIEITFYI